MTNAAQIDYWNAAAGQSWAQFHELLDQQIAPLGAAGLRELAPEPGSLILDIGCGCGDSSLSLARLVGASGRVVGVDISEPMLEVARRRLAAEPALPVKFLQRDVQADDFGTGFDAAFSRFGVMFFSAPERAFARIRSALNPAGRLVFVCWRDLTENPWMQAPLEAALPFLPERPPADPLAPGPFAFADPGRIRDILTAAGFAGVTINPFDCLIGGADLEQTRRLSFRVGPLAAALRDAPDRAEAVTAAVRARLADYVTPAGVFMPAAVWIVSAR